MTCSRSLILAVVLGCGAGADEDPKVLRACKWVFKALVDKQSKKGVYLGQAVNLEKKLRSAAHVGLTYWLPLSETRFAPGKDWDGMVAVQSSGGVIDEIRVVLELDSRKRLGEVMAHVIAAAKASGYSMVRDFFNHRSLLNRTPLDGRPDVWAGVGDGLLVIVATR